MTSQGGAWPLTELSPDVGEEPEEAAGEGLDAEEASAPHWVSFRYHSPHERQAFGILCMTCPTAGLPRVLLSLAVDHGDVDPLNSSTLPV